MKFNLTNKFSLAVILTLALVFTLGGYWIARVQERQLLAELTSGAANMSTMVADSVGTLLLEVEHERQSIQQLAEELGRFPNIAYVELFDRQARVIAHTFPERVGTASSADHVPLIREVFRTGQTQALPQDRAGHYVLFVPILGDRANPGEVVGVAEVSIKFPGATQVAQAESVARVVQNAVSQQFSHLLAEQADITRLLELVEQLDNVKSVSVFQEQFMFFSHGAGLQPGGSAQARISARVKRTLKTAQPLEEMNLAEGRFQRYTPIWVGPEGQRRVNGVVRLEMDVRPVLDTISQLGRSLAVGAFLLATTLLVILVWMVRSILIKPILVLAEASRLIARGDLDRQIEVRSDDELGELAHRFNAMTSSLKDYHFQLLRARDELEARVELRTSELHSEKERLQVTLRSIGDGVISTDAGGLVEFLNPVAEHLTGWFTAEAAGKPLGEIFHLIDETTREPLLDALHVGVAIQSLNETGLHSVLIGREGREVAIETTASVMRDDHGGVRGTVLVFRDVGVERRLRRQLQHQANHDALTGLHNRRMFEQELEHVIRSAQQDGETHVVLFLDLDQFKVVNDTCGHVAGDALLTQLTALLRDKMRASDVLARLGGDEFGVILRDCNKAQGIRVAEILLNTVREFRFVWEDKSFELGVSVGMVIVNAESSSGAAVMSAADVACYAAKDRGRNRVHVYQPDDEDSARRHGEMQWVSLITKALQEDRFVLHHQLIQPLDSQDQAMHFEVLLRMKAEDGSEIPPGAFIPAAERYNLMAGVDRWVIRSVFDHYARHWRHSLPPGHVIAVNLSGTSLNEDDLYDYVCAQLHEFGLMGDPFCFEITETAAVANLARASEFIRRVKALGFKFALDDFGCGVSSFSYLKNLPVDYLKIDGGFVRDMVIDNVDHAMVEAINRIGQVMGIRTIAEYVESAEVLEALKVLGVNFAQGYHIARPVPIPGQ